MILQGDQLGKFNFKSLTWIDTSDAKDVDTDDIVRTADMFSKMTKTTTIYLGRIGVDGTSGNHMMRGSQLELDLTGAALDTLKRRYGFEGFHLAGQSGGSKLVAGLSGLRRDIGCAVMGSPPLLTPDARKSSDQGRTAFEPSVSQLVQNCSVRLFAISDKADKRVPVGQQSGFIDKLHRAGRPAAAVLRRGDRRSAAWRSRLYRAGHRGLRSRPAGGGDCPCARHPGQAQCRLQRAQAQGSRSQGEHRGRRACAGAGRLGCDGREEVAGPVPPPQPAAPRSFSAVSICFLTGSPTFNVSAFR